MISRQEIMDVSKNINLPVNIIEKDYVLGWVLAGIANHPEIGSNWIFKGGTCIKKCYINIYRFSDDLDFTVTHPDLQKESFLIKTFKEITDWVYDNSGIELPQELISFDTYENLRSKISIQGKISYRGPMKPGGDLPRIKLDLTNDEVITLDPVLSKIYHPYSDRNENNMQVICKSYEELFAEKIRALGECLRPRDLYDVTHLYRQYRVKNSSILILKILKQKCAFKSIELPNIEILNSRPEIAELKVEWENMLSHQVASLPPFNYFWQELPEVFNWLYNPS
ncbi:MAG: hypothetical protein DDT41_00920 [candidate division WS2 bacterium]|nr:hypothetical protein [Candidatus Psychracetigena formicireducens]